MFWSNVNLSSDMFLFYLQDDDTVFVIYISEEQGL